jgi:twitching motility protein PilU
MTKRGLIIFVGATGTGKSTSLASMVGYRNQNSRGHIISIEDPIEYIHEHAGCIITQREVGMDTESFAVALKNTLRQAPDVILIGEVRTAETMQQALTFAETGHLCLCTLHANNANQALDRIQSFFPAAMHSQVWMDLSLNLKSMIAQQLLPRKDGKGRIPVVEVLLNTPLVAEYIRKGEVHLIKELMAKSTELGMQTLDQSLIAAYKEDKITSEEAVRFADSANDVRLQIKMHERADLGVGDGLGLSFDEQPDEGQFHGR